MTIRRQILTTSPALFVLAPISVAIAQVPTEPVEIARGVMLSTAAPAQGVILEENRVGSRGFPATS